MSCQPAVSPGWAWSGSDRVDLSASRKFPPPTLPLTVTTIADSHLSLASFAFLFLSLRRRGCAFSAASQRQRHQHSRSASPAPPPAASSAPAASSPSHVLATIGPGDTLPSASSVAKLVTTFITLQMSGRKMKQERMSFAGGVPKVEKSCLATR